MKNNLHPERWAKIDLYNYCIENKLVSEMKHHVQYTKQELVDAVLKDEIDKE